MSLLEDLLGLLLYKPAGPGADVTIPLGSGYSVEADRAAAAARLRAACDAAIGNPAWAPGQPGPADTHCNGAAAEIAAAAAGYGKLAGHLADKQIAIIRGDPDWREDTMERLSEHAQRGGLGFATLEEYPHGHLAAGYPDPMEASDSWGGALVPVIANVGHANKRCKLSGGFLEHQRPLIRFYLYKPEATA
ncbi:MAG: hypothetical protein V4510_09985 [bacterium]